MSITAAPDGASIALQDVELVASYNCIATDSRTIVVPGIPAKWLGRTDKPQLSPDSGIRLLDYNAGQWKESPMDPGIRAVLNLQPDYDFTQIDVIADRRQLAFLLEMALRKGEKYEKTWEGDERTFAFRFGAQVVDNIVFFVRTDDSTIVENIDKFRGFADGFKAKYFAFPDDLNDTKSHHRLVSSRLGDVRLLMRHQADGYVLDETVTNALNSYIPTGTAQQDFDNITVISGGALIPTSAMIELNTCSKMKEQTSQLDAKARECWLS